MREAMPRRLRASLWFATSFLVAAIAGGAVPRSLRSPLEAPGLIGYLYVNEGTLDRNVAGAGNVVSGYAAFADGSVALLLGSPWATGGEGPSGQVFLAAPRIGIGASGRHLFVANWGSDNLAVFDISDDGSLLAIPGSPFATGGARPEGVVLTPDGRLLFVGHSGSRAIDSFAVDGEGRPARIASLTVDSEPDGLAATPDGRFLLASLPAMGRIAVLRIGPDGRLAHVPGSPFETDAGTADGIVLGRGGAMAYVADALPSGLAVSLYSLDPAGVLRSVPGSPFSGPGGTSNIVHLVPGESTLAATLPEDNRIAGFAIGPDGPPSPPPGSPFQNGSLGVSPTRMASDPAGRFLYVVNGLSDTISQLRPESHGRLPRAAGGRAAPPTGPP